MRPRHTPGTRAGCRTPPVGMRVPRQYCKTKEGSGAERFKDWPSQEHPSPRLSLRTHHGQKKDRNPANHGQSRPQPPIPPSPLLLPLLPSPPFLLHLPVAYPELYLARTKPLRHFFKGTQARVFIFSIFVLMGLALILIPPHRPRPASFSARTGSSKRLTSSVCFAQSTSPSSSLVRHHPCFSHPWRADRVYFYRLQRNGQVTM